MLKTLEKPIKNNDFFMSLPVCAKRNIQVNHNEIICLEAISNYTLFHFSNGKTLLVSGTIKSFMARLNDRLFVRTHKSYAVNMRFMIQYDTSVEMAVLLKDGRRISISRRKRKDFIEKTHQLFGNMFA
jgi:DNA-binding LytR/AlgR family response regulator